MSEESNLDLDDSINYKQWIYSPRISLVDLSTTVREFLNLVIEKYDFLRNHYYTAKSQAKYLTNLKENLEENTAVVLVDFAENYSFQVQDAIQGYHWENSQATLHPVVVYTKRAGEVKPQSFCFISDSTKHSTNTVHAFLTRL